jgi:hypothetical protein
MKISDEAVEAAAKRISGHYGAGANNWEWYLTEAREVLEAAAPYLAAEAWDRGFDRGFYDPLAGRDRDASESAAFNPFRSQA